MRTLNKGKLIVCEGLDAVGKKTQSELIVKKLQEQGHKAALLSFPNYENVSSSLVKKFLNGDYQISQETLGTKQYVQAISMFYAVDRLSTLLSINDDGDSYLNQYLYEGVTLVCDRYSTSSMLLQPTNFEGDQFNKYNIYATVNHILWLEFEQMKLPRPDKVFILDMPTKFSISKMLDRTDLKNGMGNDIFENVTIQDKAQIVKEELLTSKYFDYWQRISCSDEQGELLSIEEINDKLMLEVEKIMNK